MITILEISFDIKMWSFVIPWNLVVDDYILKSWCRPIRMWIASRTDTIYLVIATIVNNIQISDTQLQQW